MNHHQQVVVITGAGGGIGRSIARHFYEAGSKLALLDVEIKNLDEWKGHLPSDVLLIECDITQKSDIQKARDQVLTHFNKVDVLVNSAGILPPVTPLEDIEAEAWKRTIDINVNGTFLCTQVFGEAMFENGGGSIINISSMAGLTASPKRGAYSTSKAAVLMLTQQTAIEWADRKIRANAVCPGYINTPMTAHMFENPETQKQREDLIPMGRLGTPEDVARIVYFLASPESDYINGEFIRVDGGFTLATMPKINSSGLVNK